MSSAFYDIQYKASSGQVNLDQAQGIVECFVAGIGNKDSVGDVCATGAFTKSLMRRKPRVVWGHNWNDPIGKVLEIYEVPPSDPRLPSKMRSAGIGGLYAKVQFNLNSEKGKEAFANVAFFGEEQEWSIGYKTLRAQFDPNIQANILYEVELYEVSPVLHGANQLTGTISVKSDEKMGMVPISVQQDEPNMQEDVERKLQEELSTRLGSPVKVLKTEGSVVYFTRTEGESSGAYKCRYHMDDDGAFMFGRPERFMPPQAMPNAKPVQRMPMGMPSKPMAPAPGSAPVVVPALVPGANPTSPPMVRFNFQENSVQQESQGKPKLVNEERDLAEALIKITKKYGKFNEDSTGVWAGYRPAAENPVAKIGVKCSNCVMYEGEGKCKIIDKQVEPEGKCRFAVIPEGVVTMGPVQKMNYDAEVEEDEVKWLEDVESKYPGEFLSGALRNAVKRRRNRRLMGKKVFRIDEYSEKSLNDFSDMEILDISYVLPVNPDKAFEIKQLIDPIIDYHMVDAVVEDGGIVFSGGVTRDFVEAVGAAVNDPFLGLEEKALGANLAGKFTRTTRGLTARFNPNAWDGDNDGVVQDGTPWQRPAIPGINDFSTRGKVNKRAARQAWEEYKRQGKPAIEKRPKEIVPSSIQYDETGMAMEGVPFQRGLSSGPKLSSPRAINPTAEQLDDSINKQDYDWGIDKIVDDFGKHLDELDPDELQDAYDELLSQMKMDKMKAQRDGILADDVMGDDFAATAARLAKELNLDEADAEDEAGRIFDARDKYRVRNEQYKAAVKNVKRRLRNTPDELRTNRDNGLASGERMDDNLSPKSKVSELIDELEDKWDYEKFYKSLREILDNMGNEDDVDDFLSEVKDEFRRRRREARADGLESDEVANADVDSLVAVLMDDYDMTEKEAKAEAERLIDAADDWVAARDLYTGAIEEITKKRDELRYDVPGYSNDGLASGGRILRRNRTSEDEGNDLINWAKDNWKSFSANDDEENDLLDIASRVDAGETLKEKDYDLIREYQTIDEILKNHKNDEDLMELAEAWQEGTRRVKKSEFDKARRIIEDKKQNASDLAGKRKLNTIREDEKNKIGLPINKQEEDEIIAWAAESLGGYNGQLARDIRNEEAGNRTSRTRQNMNGGAWRILKNEWLASPAKDPEPMLGKDQNGDAIPDLARQKQYLEFARTHSNPTSRRIYDESRKSGGSLTPDKWKRLKDIYDSESEYGWKNKNGKDYKGTTVGERLEINKQSNTGISSRGLASGGRDSGKDIELDIPRIDDPNIDSTEKYNAASSQRDELRDVLDNATDPDQIKKLNKAISELDKYISRVEKIAEDEMSSSTASRRSSFSASSKRSARKERIGRVKPREGLMDEKTKAGHSQSIKDKTNTGIDKFNIDNGLASGGEYYPGPDDSEEVWQDYFDRARLERQNRGPRPYGDELAYGFKEDLSNGKTDGTKRIFRRSIGWDGQAVISHQDDDIDDVFYRVLDPNNMEEDLGKLWYMSPERDATPRKAPKGWYIERMVFDDYEGYYSDEADYDFSYAIGPFDSPEAAAEFWDREGIQRDERNRKPSAGIDETPGLDENGKWIGGASEDKEREKAWKEYYDGLSSSGENGLSSGGKDKQSGVTRRKYPPRYESSKKLADLMERSARPKRSNYDYSQDSEIIPTEEQKDIIDAVMEGTDVVVGALAGTGKTSTLVALARRLKREDKGRKVIYLAFNKSAAQDARRRFKGTAVQVMTMDAMAFNWFQGLGEEQALLLKKRFNLNTKGNIGTPTSRRAIAQKFSVRGYKYVDASGNDVEISGEDIARMAIDAVERFETSADREIGLNHFGTGKGTSFKQMPESEIPPGALELANKIWKSKFDTKDENGVVISNAAITKYMALNNPDLADGTITGRRVDMAMIDEAQDLNPVFSAFIRGQKVQKVTVGDPNQAIYAFRGAKNEMDVMAEDAKYVLPLTEVFRFGPEIATAGNRVLSLFNILTGRMVGKGKKGEIVDPGSMTNADMILARTNGGVIREAMDALEAGKVVATTARAYDELESFIESWKYILGYTKTRPSNMHPELAEYDTIKQIADDIQKGTATQKTKTLFNLGQNYDIKDLEKLLGSMYVWNPSNEDGSPLEIDYPEDFEVGDLGVLGPATYEVFDNEIVLSNSYEIKNYAKAAGWSYDGKTQTWRKAASSQEQRQQALESLVDALNNGTEASVSLPESIKDGDSGNFGKTTWEVKGGELIIRDTPFDKSGDLRKRLEAQGWKLRKSGKKNPKTGKDTWEWAQRLTGDQQEDRDTLEIVSGIVSPGEGKLPKFSQEVIKASDAEIVERARTAAQAMSPNSKDREILLNVIDAYDRNGWARRKGWEKLEQAAKRKRDVPPIDTRVLTAHLSKGLEADNVKLAWDFWGPKQKEAINPMTGEKEFTGELEWPEEEHMKVIYVALTRAKKALDPGSASWVNEYTDDDDGLPNDPNIDAYGISDDGLASGGRGRKVRTYRGREVTGNAQGRRPWSEEERQAFRDGVRTRAQTIPGKKRGERVNLREEGGLASGKKPNSDKDIYDARMSGMSLDDAAKEYGMTRAEIRQAEMRHASQIRRQGGGLASGEISGDDGERDLTPEEIKQLNDDIEKELNSVQEERASEAAGREAARDLGLENPEETIANRIDELENAISDADRNGVSSELLKRQLKAAKKEQARIRRAKESTSDGGESDGGTSGGSAGIPGYDIDDAETRVRTGRTGAAGGGALEAVDKREVENRGFGIRRTNTEARNEYDAAFSAEVKKYRDKLKADGFTAEARDLTNSEIRERIEFPTYEAWRISKGYPENIVSPPTGGWLDKAWKRISKGVTGDIGQNDSRDSANPNSPWMLASSELKKLFRTNTGEQMSSKEIADVLGIGEDEVKSWDKPGAAIDRNAVEQLIEERNKAYDKVDVLNQKVDSEIEDIWGYKSKPFWGFFQPDDQNSTDPNAPGKFRILTEDEYNKVRSAGLGGAISSFMADPNNDSEPVQELTEGEITSRRTNAAISTSAQQSSRGNFPIEFLARSLKWIGRGETLDDKKQKDALYEKLSEIVDVPRKTFDEWLTKGLPAELVEELIDAGVIDGYEAVARPDIARELAKLPSPDRAKSRVEKYLKDKGFSDEEINRIFNYTFSPPDKQLQKTLYAQHKKKKENAAKRRADSGGKIKLSGAGGSSKSQRAAITNEEADTFVSRLNERLAKSGKPEVTKEELFGSTRSDGLSSGGLASGSSTLRNTSRSGGKNSETKLSKTPSAKEISAFVDTATQRGRTSGAASRDEMLRPGAGELQVSRLKNALRAREFLANQFPDIADDPNLTVQDLANTDIDNPQEAIDSIQRLDNYIRSILDQADEMGRSMRLQEDAIKRDEASKARVEEMLNSLEDGDVEVERGLRSTLDKLNETIATGKAKIEQDYAPIANTRDEMLQMANASRGFSRNIGRNKQQRTKGARAAANKRLISV